MNKKKITLAFAGAFLALAGGATIALTTTANAATTPVKAAAATIPAVQPGMISILPTMPRIVGPSAPVSLATGAQVSLDIGGQTFSGYAVPANATGVTVSITSISPQGTGSLKVWTTGTGEPGTPTLNYNAGETNTTIAFTGLDSDGKLNVKAVGAGTKFMMGLIGYVTPATGPGTTGTGTTTPTTAPTTTPTTTPTTAPTTNAPTDPPTLILPSAPLSVAHAHGTNLHGNK